MTAPNVNRKLTKREKRILRQQNAEVENHSPNFGLDMKLIRPLTDNQRLAFSSYEDGKNLMLHGIAGTGKSFIGVALALQEILSGTSSKKKLVIVRSVVPTRDMGFLPGNAKEKAAVYEAPYVAICTELFGRGDAYGILSQKGIIQFISTSFIRGTSINDAIILVDECANLNGHELDSVITRVGKNSRIVFAGDFRQSDFSTERERNGFHKFLRILKEIKSFDFIDFQKEDIVRSNLVKAYILAKDKLNIEL